MWSPGGFLLFLPVLFFRFGPKTLCSGLRVDVAQTPRGGLYGSPSKGHHGVCAIYSETTAIRKDGADGAPVIGWCMEPFPKSIVPTWL